MSQCAVYPRTIRSTTGRVGHSARILPPVVPSGQLCSPYSIAPAVSPIMTGASSGAAVHGGEESPLVACAGMDAALIDLIRLVLLDAGYRVVTAVASSDARLADTLALVAPLRPDVTLVALHDAVEPSQRWIQDLRDTVPSAGLVLLSAMPGQVSTVDAVPVVPMPFDIDEMCAAVARVVQSPAPGFVASRPVRFTGRPSTVCSRRGQRWARTDRESLLIDVLTDLALLATLDPAGAVASLTSACGVCQGCAESVVDALAAARSPADFRGAVSVATALLVRQQACPSRRGS